ncbi:MAG: M48 family metalloprotease [Rhizobiaceae bacterium]|nr:M48 family metalloprotease [Rhizobiaceae bacterium]
MRSLRACSLKVKFPALQNKRSCEQENGLIVATKQVVCDGNETLNRDLKTPNSQSHGEPVGHFESAIGASLMFHRANGLKFLLATIFVSILLIESILPAEAQRRRGGLPLVRDAEIEALIKDYTTPIFKAAGIHGKNVEVFLLNRNEFNAFVTGTRMFINTGAIMQAGTPNEVIGVFAHETGHIVGGHLTRLRDSLEKAQILSVLGLLAGVGVAAGGNTDAGAAIALGSGTAAQRNFLSYQRSEEMAADRTGVDLLNRTKQSSKGMLTTFKRLGQNPLFSTGRLDPYALSHPLPRERIGLLQTVAQESPYFNKLDSPVLQRRHDLARAKIAAYAGGAGLVRNLFRKNLNGEAGTYGIAISHYLQGSAKKGIALIDKLIKKDPNNPYFHEIRGEMLLRSGKASAAAKAFQTAVKLDRRNNGLIRIQLGHALIETGNKANLESAVKVLKAGVGRDKYSSRGYGLLARAYAQQGNQTLAIAATAEEKFLQGRVDEAKQFAARALPRINRGSPQWRRLQDIMDFRK